MLPMTHARQGQGIQGKVQRKGFAVFNHSTNIFQLRLICNPPSVNHYWQTARGGRKFLSKRARELKADIKEVCKFANMKMLQGPLEITLCLCFGDKRRRDWDNYIKGICDALEGIAYEDDSQIMKGTVEKLYKKNDPYIEVIIKERGGEDHEVQETGKALPEGVSIVPVVEAN